MYKFGISYYSMQAGARIPLSGIDVRILRPGQSWAQGMPLAESSPESGYYEISILTEDNSGFYEIWDNRSGSGAYSGKTCIIGKVDFRALQLGSVNQDRIANTAVSNDKIAQDAVREPHILGAAVTSQKIADRAVTTPKIEDHAVTGDKVSPAAIGTVHVADGAITPEKLNSSVFIPKVAVQTALQGMGNVSASSPPDYQLDDEYSHTYLFPASANEPVALLEQKGEYPVTVKSISYTGASQGLSMLTVVVKGEIGRVINYRLIIMEIQ